MNMIKTSIIAALLTSVVATPGAESTIRYDTPLITFERFPSINVAEKTANASKAELAATADLPTFLTHLPEYVGKVVKVQFNRADFVTSGSHAILVIHDLDDALQTTLHLQNSVDAREWAIDIDKEDGAGEIYVFVDTDELYATGTRRRKTNTGYDYKW